MNVTKDEVKGAGKRQRSSDPISNNNNHNQKEKAG